MEAKKIFLSYSHDSKKHKKRVAELVERLRHDGFDARIDQHENGTPEKGWPRWMLDQFDEADRVLLICTKTYYQRFRGRGEPGKGKGATWEGAIITEEIYNKWGRTKKFVPVLFEEGQEEFIPEPVRGHTYYLLTLEGCYQELCDALLDQAGVEPGPLGELPLRSRRKAEPMVFGREALPNAAIVAPSHLDHPALLTPERKRRTPAGLKYGFEDVSRKLVDSLGFDPVVTEAHSRRASEELDHVKKRRASEPVKAREQIRQLLERVQAGDLKNADRSAQAEVLYWAARLLGSESEYLEEAKDFRDRLRQLNDLADTRIIDALIMATEGDGDGALRKLRDAEDPDARSSFFSILLKVKSRDDAHEWFDNIKERQNPLLLTGIGWYNVAVTLAQADRWEEASSYLARTNHAQQEEWPDLPFLEGLVNAALLLPIELRQHTLEMNVFHPELNTVEGPEADRNRERATYCFQQVQDRLANEFPLRALGARHWLLWLRLTHPNSAVGQRAREEVRETMKDPGQALLLLPVARAFGIPIDADILRSFLDRRARLGGLEDHELRAQFMLAEMTLEPADLIAFLNEKELVLRRVLPPRLITGKRIEALVEDGQPAKARSLLEAHRDEFEEDDQQRIEALIEVHEGLDPRPKLERLYEACHRLLDLRNLVNFLRDVKDWPALRTRLGELFEKERTLKNARNLVDCFQNDPTSNDTDIITFLETNSDLTERCQQLTSAKAWALFRIGRLDDAQVLNEQLLSKRRTFMDLQLEINLALQSGAWERFSGIVEREWMKREEHAPGVLIQLASLAAEANKSDSRAIELLRLAATKEFDDPNVLTAAVDLTFRLGREGEELQGWLDRASALSSEEGPIRVLDLRTVIEELMPAHRERTNAIQEHWRRGTIPLHFVSAELNSPISNLLIGLPRSNALLHDGRRRVVIPIISGAREPVEIQPDWSIGVDVSSLMVLAYLGRLSDVIEKAQSIVLAPDTMLVLLNERNRARFHQPSLVKGAAEILELIGSGKLRVDEFLPAPPQSLSDEVGADLAQLLEAAAECKGYVVRPRPIHKLRSLLEEEAHLGDYDSRVLSTLALVRLLNEKGLLDRQTHERASRFLLSQDRGTRSDTENIALDRTVFLDDLAVSYLQSAGLLHKLVSYGLDFRIHPSLRQAQVDLIAQGREGERLADTIEDVRRVLQIAIQTGRARFLPRHNLEAGGKSSYKQAPTLSQFLLGAGSYDALLIDDRFSNGNREVIDEMGKATPTLCVIDILRYLEAQGALTPAEYQVDLHRLRQAGFAFIPLKAEELLHLLTSVEKGTDDTFTESAELRVIRQTLARIRCLDMLRQPQEVTFLRHLWQDSLRVIRELWIDQSISTERAVDLTDWIWLHVAPSPLDWNRDTGHESFAGFLHELLHPQPFQGKRQEAYFTWLEESVLAPLVSTNAKALDELGKLTSRQIKAWVERIAEEGTESLVTKYLIGLYPPSIRETLRENQDISGLLDNETDSTILIGDRFSWSTSELFATARRLLAQGGDTEPLYSQEAGQASISRDGNSIWVHISPQAGEKIEIPFDELGVLASDPQIRTRVLDQCFQKIGPTGPDFASLLHSALERELTDREVDGLLQTLWEGVAGIQERLQIRLEAGSAKLWDLVPNSLDYFERFCGPNPEGIPGREYLISVLPDYRKGLLRKHLGKGLKICLQGCLRDDLCPGAWLAEIGDDELWAALQTCMPQLEPFSLLGALDIALYRTHDERFRAFAEEAVSLLTAEQFPDSSGFDLYQLLPLLAQLTLDRINQLEGGVLRAPFWRRLCSYMQASVALRLMSGLDVDYADLCNQIGHSLQPLGSYIKILDLQREPMYQSSALTSAELRSEVVGRLMQIKDRHQSANREIPRLDRIDGAARTTSPLSWAAPGPLEGFQRPEEARSMIEQQVKDGLTKLSAEHLLPKMVSLSQLVYFDEETISPLREMISVCEFNNVASAPDGQLFRFTNAGLIAAAQRDQSLANAIAEGVLSLAPSLQEGAVSLALQGLLVASAAFEEEASWAEWLKAQLANLAGLLPAGLATVRLYDLLQALKRVMKLHLSITVRAEALASAASSSLL